MDKIIENWSKILKKLHEVVAEIVLHKNIEHAFMQWLQNILQECG